MKSNLAKKQITMLTLVLALAVAVYLNWRFAKAGDNTLSLTEALNGEVAASAEDNDERYYGEAEFVSTTTGDTAKFFAQARLEREQSRAAALDTLEKALSKSDLTDAEKAEILQQLQALSESIAVESNIEQLIKAKGFDDCVAYVNGETVKVVVKTKGAELSTSDVSQIKEIVVSESGVPAQSIVIIGIE